MRILLVNKYIRVTGGADRHCLDLASLLQGRDHAVRFLSSTGGPSGKLGGAFVTPTVTHETRDRLSPSQQLATATRALWNRSAAAAMRFLISDFQPEVVHAHKLYPQLSVAPIVVARQLRVPVVQTAHDYEFVSASAEDHTGARFDRQETRLQYRALNTVLFQAKRCLHVPTVTEWISVSRAVAQIYAAGGIETTTIPNFTLNAPSAKGGNERVGIVFAGRLTELKGVLDVLEVARLLPGAKVRIAGEGPLKDEVCRAAAARSNLEFLGHLDAAGVQRLLASARVCLMPSRWEEPAGLVSLEAMAAGTPIVAYAVGGLCNYVADSGAGAIVPVGDRSGLVEACRLLLGDSGWDQKSKAGVAAVRTVHSPDRYLAELEAVYTRARALSAIT
jgi:glycosyltransferase involved in cell wall biosynthesis